MAVSDPLEAAIRLRSPRRRTLAGFRPAWLRLQCPVPSIGVCPLSASRQRLFEQSSGRKKYTSWKEANLRAGFPGSGGQEGPGRVPCLSFEAAVGLPRGGFFFGGVGAAGEGEVRCAFLFFLFSAALQCSA